MKISLNLFYQLQLRYSPGPLIARFETNEEFGIKITGSIRSVVRTAQLADNRCDLGIFAKDGPHLIGELVRVTERNCVGHACPHPQIAFLELGHELTTEKWQQRQCSQQR